jgi:hypothetical protein
MEMQNRQLNFALPMCVPVPVPCDRLIPFFRITGSLAEWSAGLISNYELGRVLRKAAAEVEHGGF